MHSNLEVIKPLRYKFMFRSLIQVFFVAFCLSAFAGEEQQPTPFLGVEAVVGPLPFYERDEFLVRARTAADPQPQLTMLLSRDRYWAEDGHLEVIVALAPPPGVDLAETVLRLEWQDDAGNTLSHNELAPPPWRNLALYPPLPENQSGDVTIRAIWRRGDGLLGEASGGIRIESAGSASFPDDGISLRIPNPNQVTAGGIPFSVGVPFPRGMIDDTASLRLVTADGTPIPAQFETTGRWSKYGSLKWVRCDFSADLNGEALELFVIESAQGAASVGPEIAVRLGDGVPFVDAGQIVLDDGLWLRTGGEGSERRKILTARALTGGFVEHEDGRLFQMPLDAPYTVEEVGAERIVLLQRGWYQNDVNRSDQFCQFEVRLIVYRDSPLLRVFHTWIFTGDSSRDRIRSMGWQLPTAEGTLGSAAFRSAFGPDGEWVPGDYLLQYGQRGFDIARDGTLQPFDDGRAPGIARLELPAATLYFGARNFWQSFPAEIEYAGDALWFYSWPRHGRPRPDPLVDPSRAVMLDFAHSGEVLDLRLPDAYTEEPLDSTHAKVGALSERVWLTETPESVNAQGLARTEEFWLYFDHRSQADGDAAAVALLEGIDLETIRAVVDPQWMMKTGVFFEAHHSDPENYPEFERRYSEFVAPINIDRAEQAGLYGMWLYGEHLWNWYDTGNLYRALRKGHGGYGPLSWMPYARSGDPQLLKWQDASMRRMIDANFCHYVSPDVAEKARGGSNLKRRPGFWARGPLPWAGRAVDVLSYERQPHQWWSAWHMTGYHRARDMALTTYPQLAKENALELRALRGNRHNEALIKAMVDSYEGTFDPWFLTWAHAIAELQRDAWAAGRWQPYTRNWMPGDREFHRFTGDPEHGDYYVDLVRSSTEPLRSATALAYAWHVSGEEEFLRRLSGVVGELEESGTVGGLGSRVDNSSDLPMALGAFEKAGYRPDAVHLRFPLRKQSFETLADGRNVFQTPTAAVLKEDGQPLELSLRFRPELVPDHKELTIFGPDGELFLSHVIGGSRDPDGSSYVEILEIPASAPSGVYRVECTITSGAARNTDTRNFLRGLMFPLTPIGSKEVIIVDEERMGPTGLWNVFYAPTQGFFFYVPADVESFTVSNIHSGRIASIWNPDGEVVWEENSRGAMSATIEVAPEHRGRLWRIRGGGFMMDPRIPPWFAIDRDRWFEPASPAGQR